METIEKSKSIDIVNDLIEINNDRVAGFAHASKDLGDNDMDIRALFQVFREESRNNVHELSSAINRMGVEPEMEMSNTGALHRAWLDIKATFTGHDRKSVLEECERGEDAIKKTYDNALLAESNLSPELIEIIERQQQSIIAAHDQIKALRDKEA